MIKRLYIQQDICDLLDTLLHFHKANINEFTSVRHLLLEPRKGQIHRISSLEKHIKGGIAQW